MLKKIKNVLVSVAVMGGIVIGLESIVVGADAGVKLIEGLPVQKVSEIHTPHDELKPMEEQHVIDLFHDIHKNSLPTVQDAIVRFELRDIRLNQLEAKSDAISKGYLPANIENYHFDVENEPAVPVTQEEIDKIFESDATKETRENAPKEDGREILDEELPVEHTYDNPEPEKEKKTFVVTYYTSLGMENGGYENLAARGNELKEGTVATSAHIPFDTKFNLPEIGEVVVDDRMAGWAVEKRKADHGEHTIPVDVYVPRAEGESDEDYFTRVDNMGVKVVDGTVEHWG